MGKKILVCFDGSGENPELNGPNKEADTGFSNIVKLHVLAGGSLDPDKEPKEIVPNQISLYIAGVGGISDNAYFRYMNNLFLGIISIQTVPMRKKLEKVYEEGDSIILTGFSRGASAARAFAVELQEEGLLTKDGKLVSNPNVDLLACFDTVSDQFAKGCLNPLTRWSYWKRMFTLSTQSAEVLGETGGKLPGIVKKAVHNVCLDDGRAGNFAPVLMDINDPRVHEAWFPGVHSDIGGSYYTDGVSNVSGRYMQQFMEEAGLVFLKPEEVSDDSLFMPALPDEKIDRKYISLEPDATANSHHAMMFVDRERPIVTVSKDELYEEGVVRIHKSLLERITSGSPKMLKDGELVKYELNPNLKTTNFVVVGDFNKELPGKGEELKEAIEKY